MKSDLQPSAQEVHDQLLAIQPAGIVHEPCELCSGPVQKPKEVAQVSGDRTYAEAEHLALMADAVTRETAALTEVKAGLETRVSELAARVDVLEAEKTAAETATSTTKADFDAYKADVERAREVESAKQERLSKVKAANEALPDSYYTDERIQRWAEMSEQAFAALIDDLTAAATAGPVKETAAFAGGTSPTSTKTVTVGSIFAARRGGTQ